jgi:hypothetical protein
MPVEVEGDVEWLVNRGEKGWLVTLLNPAGSCRSRASSDGLPRKSDGDGAVSCADDIGRATIAADERLEVKDGRHAEVSAGGVRVIELR